MKNKQKTVQQAKLILEDGSEYTGWSFGRRRSVAGEVVFNTGMSGLTQTLTDPGCKGQILVCTWPIAGNLGAPVRKNGKPFFDEQGIPKIVESDKIQVSGLVVSDLCEKESHYSANISLSAWLEKGKVPGIYGIDTRALAIHLRERGTMRGKIVTDGLDVSYDKIKNSNHKGVLPNEIKTYTPSANKSGIKIALIDCGVKANIIRCLLSRGAEVIRIPCDFSLDKIEYDGLFISSGPGDPKKYKKAIEAVKKAYSQSKPTFGICLGCQIMAIAAGADTYKLPFGHRGLNQPCHEEGTDRCYVTYQNHGYAIKSGSLKQGWKQWFTNANDGTIEGIKNDTLPFSGVLFHPEGCPGSRDTEFVFDRFIDQVKEKK
jgi:carbamoyl-phosphate synthase small subunit